MEWGHCKPVGDASWREFSYPQESLPKAIEILLCLLDGAERRRRILLGVDSPGGTSNTLLIRLCPPRAWLRGSVAWLAMAKLCLPDFHQGSGLPGVATYNWLRLKPRFKRAASEVQLRDTRSFRKPIGRARLNLAARVWPRKLSGTRGSFSSSREATRAEDPAALSFAVPICASIRNQLAFLTKAARACRGRVSSDAARS